jgi:RHH-type proline utilization regulon transcriptional repressor/proline dehydrogenase/delta 1-pyrroline-5-carboxylate dehydrogenase
VLASRPATDVEPATRAWGARIGERLSARRRSPAAVAERRVLGALIGDPALRAALFRLVDVRPACTGRRDLVRHLAEFLADAGGSRTASGLAALIDRRGMRLPAAEAASVAVQIMARRFIAGADAASAATEFAALWRDGRCVTVDLLGEATLTEGEGDRYTARCADAVRVLAADAAGWPARRGLEHDGLGPLPRVNLSVKVSAMTPSLRANAPARAFEGAADRLRSLLRLARDNGAHLHVDMEALDTREPITRLLLELLAEPEFADGPSAGIVVQAYLTDSEEQVERLLQWVDAHPRREPFTVRLVKGAYWDHEIVQATQSGWPAPVFGERRACDRHYEHLTRVLLDARAAGRPIRLAVASHNLRSLAHALAYSDHVGLPADALELQVLRGLGDDTGAALAALGRRVRVYCPVGDLVSGMAYLVRRLLENTSNDSFLAAHAAGADLDALLARP